MSFSPTLTKVSSNEEIHSVAQLAKEIWEEHYTPIIGTKQVEYMLTNFQSTDAIQSQISDGIEYYLISIHNSAVGYTGLVADMQQKTMMLSKIYVSPSMQNKGLGFTLLSFIECLCIAKGLKMLHLTVNNQNHSAITWYTKHGFTTTDTVKVAIGGGFFMDDYIMQKHL